MTDTNPPEERATTDCETDPDKKPEHQYRLLRPFGSSTNPSGLLREFGRSSADDREAETLSLQTWDFLQKEEPDAGRRAILWLMAQRWIADDYDSELLGARRADAWLRAMCKPCSTAQPG